jgi:hypothetical protein
MGHIFELFQSFSIVTFTLVETQSTVDREEAIVGILEAPRYIGFRASVFGLVLILEMHQKKEILPKKYPKA